MRPNEVEVVLVNGETNVSYTLKISADDAKKVSEDMQFAAKLLRMAEKQRQASDICNEDATIGENLIQNDNDACPSSAEHDEAAIDNHPVSADAANQDAFDTDADPKDGSYKWTYAACMFFMETYKMLEASFNSGKTSVKACWKEVAAKMNSKGYNVTWDKCATKMNSLKKTYKSVTDHNNKSGSSRRKWIYYDKCDEIFSNKPWIEPLSIASSTSCMDSNDDIPAVTTPKKERKLSNIVEQYLDKAMEQREQTRIVKDRQHEATLQRVDRMNDLLEKLITKHTAEVDLTP